jgi:hypothetical protein
MKKVTKLKMVDMVEKNRYPDKRYIKCTIHIMYLEVLGCPTTRWERSQLPS